MKSFTEFFRCKAFKDGRDYTCKVCNKARRIAWAAANRARTREIGRESARRNMTPARSASAFSKWYAKTKVDGTYYKQVERVTRRRRLISEHATPAWANNFFIEEIYDLAQLRTKATGIEWHVDHIVPLQSPIVCGLHVEQNMRVITAFENRSKRNRYWPDMPLTNNNERVEMNSTIKP